VPTKKGHSAAPETFVANYVDASGKGCLSQGKKKKNARPARGRGKQHEFWEGKPPKMSGEGKPTRRIKKKHRQKKTPERKR